jgi:hypothetical protein
MNTITARIQLINSYKPLFTTKDKPLRTRIVNCQIALYFSGILFLVTSSIGFLTILIELAGIQDVFEWNKMGYLALLLIGSSFNFQNSVYQYLLLKHIQFLKNNSEQFVEWEINKTLQKIIKQLNKPIKSKILIVTAGCIITGAFLNFSGNSQFDFWNFFKIPFVLYTFYFLKLFWNKYKQLIEHLIQVEIESQLTIQPPNTSR